VIHFTLTWVMLLLGTLLALPGDTFDTGQGWRLFAAIASENVWAVILGTVGCVGAVGLISTGWVRLGSVFVLASAHGLLAGMFWYSNPWGAGSIFCAGLASQGYYLMFRRVRQCAPTKWQS
jgi:hypothetical protein